MRDGNGAPNQARRPSHHATEPAIQVICLGAGGGPSEDNVTGVLVRSTASNWAKNSVLAVDAGSHLAAITRILETEFPLVSGARHVTSSREGNNFKDYAPSPKTGGSGSGSEDEDLDSVASSPGTASPTLTTLETGPFAGLAFPHTSARANALHVVREHVSTYLITHPHLDHVSGFVINTAAFHNTSRPKRLAALPFTVNAIKTHLFNNIIWPNLTDEDGGVGLVTFQRLAEGGNITLGEGPSRGYIEVCDGLGVKGFRVSHGHCMRGPGHVHRGSTANAAETPGHPSLPHAPANVTVNEGKEGRSLSFSIPSQPGTPLFTGSTGEAKRGSHQYEECVIDSSAYFIRTEQTHINTAREVLIFGDVEPDSISLSPRTTQVWQEAAPKIASGVLTGILIECSYTNSQGDAVLYGHLAPRHLIAELQSLGEMVKEAKKEIEREREEHRKGRKRKRASNSFLTADGGASGQPDGGQVRKASRSKPPPSDPKELLDESMPDYAASPTPGAGRFTGTSTGTATPTGHPSAPAVLNLSHASAEHTKAMLSAASDPPLKGVKVVIIHVKDTLADGPLVGETILQELVDAEGALAEQGKGLGCTFVISKGGGSYFF